MDILAIRDRNRLIGGVFALMTVVSVLAIHVTEFSTLDALAAIPRAFIWMASNFYPDAKSMNNLGPVLLRLKETVFLSIVATTTAGVLALVFALLSVRSAKPIAAFCRMTASAFRNIPDVVWAIVLLFSFGQNIISGYFAIFFATFGMLTRAFIEAIQEASVGAVEAIEATGATYPQVVFQAILPSIMTQIITWVFFMVETNIRSSTLVGMLTATGVGHLFNLYYKSFDYHSASLVVLSIIIIIFIVEFISNYVRRVIL